MSEPEATEAASDGITAGMLLRRAREAAGLHIATLAVSLKVPVRKLEALEDDRYDQLADAVFVRALASSVCRTLKIDPRPVLERLPLGARPRLVQPGDGINTPFRAPGDGPRPGLLDQVTRPVALAVVALLLGALVIIFLPTMREEVASAGRADALAGNAQPVVTPSSLPSPGVQDVPPAAVTAPASTGADAAAALKPPMVMTPAPAVSAPALVASPKLASLPASAAPPAAGPAAAKDAADSTAATANSVVTFKASAQSWVQVTDAKGNPVLTKLLEAGETAGAAGALPLQVTVGSAPSTEVRVRGRPLDLAPVTRDNVARFEVK